MDKIEIKFADHGRGAFFMEEDGERIAEMKIGVEGERLTVYHTEVADKLKGKGVAPLLLSTMVAYARDNKLKVVPLCAYVQAQFNRRATEYADLWQPE